jgi:hypothetical protein
MADPVKSFHQAARDNNVSELQRLIVVGVHTDVVDSNVCITHRHLFSGTVTTGSV